MFAMASCILHVTAIGYTPTAIGYTPTAINYPPTAIGYTPTAIGYPPTAIGYPPTAIGYPPTAISYPPAAIIGRIGHSEFLFYFIMATPGPTCGLFLILSHHCEIHRLLPGPPKIRFSTSDRCNF